MPRARLSPLLGRDAAHARVEQAAGEVRGGGGPLRDVLARDGALREAGLSTAFDLGPAIAAAGPWIDRALGYAETVRHTL